MGMTELKAHILVVEDDPSILRGLLDVLVFNGYRATGREDGREGRDTALGEKFDLVILDVMLPSLDGFSICRELRREKPGQSIMMLTAKGSEDDIVTGFTAGADDYVNKPFSLRELMVRVEALLRRSGKAPTPENLLLGPITFDSVKLTAVQGHNTEEITRREMDIISYFQKNRDRIISKQEFLSKVWNYTVTDIETRTVDIHIQKLRKKLSRLLGDTPLIITVRGEGYRLEVSE